MGSDKTGKFRGELSREEAVQHLQTVVDQLRSGTASIGERAITLADRVRLKMEAESDELEITLKWKKDAVPHEAVPAASESY